MTYPSLFWTGHHFRRLNVNDFSVCNRVQPEKTKIGIISINDTVGELIIEVEREQQMRKCG
jgi:hypothetical protein